MIENTRRPAAGSTIFMPLGHGDLKIEWDEANHDAVVAAIQTKMDAGITFHIIDPESKAKRPPLVEIANPAQITNRQVYVRDPDIRHLVEAGFASIVSNFEGVGQLRTKGKAKTAEEAATTDTIAVRPAQGG